MRRILLAVVFLAAMSFGSAPAQATQYNFDNATIYEYEGIRESSESGIFHGSASFTILVRGSGGNTLFYRVWAWAHTINIEVRNDGLTVATTLNVVRATLNDWSREYFAESVTVLVANQNDAEIWRQHLNGLRERFGSVGPCGEISTCFRGQQIVAFETQMSNPWENVWPTNNRYYPDWGRQYIHKVEVPASAIRIQVSENQNETEVRVKAEWLHSLFFNHGAGKVEVRAGSLVIIVPSDKLAEWNERLNQWRSQTSPHRVTPQ